MIWWARLWLRVIGKGLLIEQILVPVPTAADRERDDLEALYALPARSPKR